jgi:hypothetical protein
LELWSVGDPLHFSHVSLLQCVRQRLTISILFLHRNRIRCLTSVRTTGNLTFWYLRPNDTNQWTLQPCIGMHLNDRFQLLFLLITRKRRSINMSANGYSF